MFSIVLYQPEIPPNTGNIIRLCANTGCDLHLIKPLGFQLDDKRLRRAGLDYREFAYVHVHNDLRTCLDVLGSPRLLALTTKGTTRYTDVGYKNKDALLFGPETRGLPQSVLQEVEEHYWLRIPMLTEKRSLNLSNAVSVVVYEAWRQLGFEGIPA